jgi:hypothetical protein
MGQMQGLQRNYTLQQHCSLRHVVRLRSLSLSQLHCMQFHLHTRTLLQYTSSYQSALRSGAARCSWTYMTLSNLKLHAFVDLPWYLQMPQCYVRYCLQHGLQDY